MASCLLVTCISAHSNNLLILPNYGCILFVQILVDPYLLSELSSYEVLYIELLQ